MGDVIDVDLLIARLLSVRGAPSKREISLTEKEIQFLCSKSSEIFLQQPSLLEISAPINICGKIFSLTLLLFPLIFKAGDIHGQYYDLLRLFEYGGFPPAANYLFLG